MLMLSGIGPADHLQSIGIKPILDQPGIGSNLHDHLDLFVIVFAGLQMLLQRVLRELPVFVMQKRAAGRADDASRL